MQKTLAGKAAFSSLVGIGSGLDVFGVMSSIVLALAILARYRFGFTGAWRRTFVVSASIALYLIVASMKARDMPVGVRS